LHAHFSTSSSAQLTALLPPVFARHPGFPACSCAWLAALALLLLLQVLLDLQEECGKHGAVYEVKVPRPANPKAARALFGTGNYGKVRVSVHGSDIVKKVKHLLS
jgi:hypothetical protein